MKIPEAIEILLDLTRYDYNPTNPDAQDALKLGIEALKDLRKHRKYPQSGVNPKLPGETED